MSTTLINKLKAGFAAAVGIPIAHVLYTGIITAQRRLNEEDSEFEKDSDIVLISFSPQAMDNLLHTLEEVMGKENVLCVDHVGDRDASISAATWERLGNGGKKGNDYVSLAAEVDDVLAVDVQTSKRALLQSTYTVGITTITVKVGGIYVCR